MNKKSVVFGGCILLLGCGADPDTKADGPGLYQVGEQVDLNGDGVSDGVAVDSDRDGKADSVDVNGDGVGDNALPTLRNELRPDGGAVDSGLPPGFDAGPPAADAGLPPGSCAAINAQAELMRGPVDIVIALDTSLSMAPQICNVSANLTKFANGVGSTSHVVTVYEMGILGGFTAALCGGADPLAATPLASDAQRYLHNTGNVDSWNALSVLLNQFDSYKSFLRPTAPTHFIVVSDDESTMASAEFKTKMEQKLGHGFFFHAIVATGNGCLGASVGNQYLMLADATMGQKLPICTQDWSQLFAKLESAVAASAPLPCDFDIPPAPTGKTFNANEVSVVFTPPGQPAAPFPLASSQAQCASNAAWFYDDPGAPKRIELCPTACSQVKAGGAISIAFGCASPILE